MTHLTTMKAFTQCLRRPTARLAVAAALVCSALGHGTAAQAALQFSPYSGQGNVSVFDASAGSGGWVGSIDGLVHPQSGDPFELVSVVLFTVDSLDLTVSGQFEWTSAADLASSLFGRLSGTVSRADTLLQGGQFALDYLIDGGTGAFAGARGFGLAFVDFDPLAGPDNYFESGLVVASVPVPASPLLALTALLALAALRRSGKEQTR
jgi:hypothetical protein